MMVSVVVKVFQAIPIDVRSNGGRVSGRMDWLGLSFNDSLELKIVSRFLFFRIFPLVPFFYACGSQWHGIRYVRLLCWASLCESSQGGRVAWPVLD